MDPDAGYELDRITVVNSSGGEIDVERLSAAEYTFEMPGRRVIVEAVFTEIPEEPAPEPDPEPKPAALPFTDVGTGDWYYNAVRWATSAGVVNGVGDNTFAPNDPLTREQMALILYRYAQHKSYDVQVDGEPLEGFQDVEKISDWAVEAMAWAVNAKLLSGTGDNLLTPAGTATRAQVAQVLANFRQTVA